MFGFAVVTASVFALGFEAPVWSAGQEVPKKKPETASLVEVDRQIADMNSVLQKILGKLRKAREKNDIRQVNCLTPKLNIIKGLLTASERARIVLQAASAGGDTETAGAYARRIRLYRDRGAEVEKTPGECTGEEVERGGTTLVYVRPERGDGLESGEISPFDVESEAETPGPFPVIPPASPFR